MKENEMMYIALQTNMGIDKVNEALMAIGFESWRTPFKNDANQIYAASWWDPYESPKTLDDFTTEEIEAEYKRRTRYDQHPISKNKSN